MAMSLNESYGNCVLHCEASSSGHGQLKSLAWPCRHAFEQPAVATVMTAYIMGFGGLDSPD